jgi:hypothetical protein
VVQLIERLIEKLNTPFVVVPVLVLFLALDGFLFYRYQQALQSTAEEGATNAQVEKKEIAKETTTSFLTVNDAASAQAEETAKEMTPSPEEQNGVQVDVGVVNTPVGLSIWEDGLIVREQVTNPGFYEEVEAEEAITIMAADGGAVLVGVNDENVEALGESGVGVTRTFTNESER